MEDIKGNAEKKESTASVTISVDYPQMKTMLSFMERLLADNERLINAMKTYHERLAKLERFTQE